MDTSRAKQKMTLRTVPRVLVVDDNLMTAELVCRLFMNEGMEAKLASDGAQAIEMVEVYAPDLVLLDVMMPGMSGYEVLDRIRSNPGTRDIPAIFITAKDEPSDLELGLGLGADDYIPKPFNHRELLARSRSKIEAYRLRQALRRRTEDLQALLTVSEQLSKRIDVDALVKLIADLVVEHVPVELCIVSVSLGAGDSRYAIAWSQGQPAADYDPTAVMANGMIEKPLPYVWATASESPLGRYGSGFALPLEYDAATQGMLLSASDSPFDPRSFDLCHAIAKQAALALHNADMYAVVANYAVDLANQVEIRTKELELSNRMLIRTEKLASTGRLAAGLAHEINNPLLPLTLILEDILENLDLDRPIERQGVVEALASAARIRTTIEGLLSFTRAGIDDQDQSQTTEVAEAITSIIALSQKMLSQDGIETHLELEPGLVVLGYRGQLEQVFLNLILNACQSMNGGGSLTVQSESKGSYALIRFRDTGKGIPFGKAEAIFEPFYTERLDGTGLGLFISNQIVEAHHGKISVDSQVGVGSVFSVQLPLVASNDGVRVGRSRHPEIPNQ
jgi:signal transduction histidine kinase/DNA-binding NarL/FixJ family response regulator